MYTGCFKFDPHHGDLAYQWRQRVCLNLAKLLNFLLINNPKRKIGYDFWYSKYFQKTKILKFSVLIVAPLLEEISKNKKHFLTVTFSSLCDSVIRFFTKRFVFYKPSSSFLFLMGAILDFTIFKYYIFFLLQRYNTCWKNF